MFLVLAGGVFAGCVCQDKLKFFQLISCQLDTRVICLDELHLRVLATSSEDLTQKINAQEGLDDIIRFFFFPFISIFFLETVLKLMTLGPTSGAISIHICPIFFRRFFH